MDALRAAGYPATEDQVSGWELGADIENLKITIVPGWALVGAAEVSKRTVGELLTMAGVEDQEPLRQEVAALRKDHEALVAALNEVRANQGLPPLPEHRAAAQD